jgi:hypothetical protein
MDDPVAPTYSVSFRVQRTTTEFSYVSVPVTADLMIEHAAGIGWSRGRCLTARSV